MSHFGSVATIDYSAPSLKRLLKTRGAAPPIGASPGELRLWLKMNGLFDDATADKRTKLKGMRPRPTRSSARLPPIGERSTLEAAAAPLPLPGRKPLLGVPAVVADNVERRSHAMLHGVPRDENAVDASAVAARPKARTRAVFPGEAPPAHDATAEATSMAAEAEAKAAVKRAKARTKELAEAEARAEAEAQVEAHARAQAELAELAEAERAAEAEMEALNKQLAQEQEPKALVLHELNPEPGAVEEEAMEQQVVSEQAEAGEEEAVGVAAEEAAAEEKEELSVGSTAAEEALLAEDNSPMEDDMPAGEDVNDDLEAASDHGELDLP